MPHLTTAQIALLEDNPDALLGDSSEAQLEGGGAGVLLEGSLRTAGNQGIWLAGHQDLLAFDHP